MQMMCGVLATRGLHNIAIENIFVGPLQYITQAHMY